MGGVTGSRGCGEMGTDFQAGGVTYVDTGGSDRIVPANEIYPLDFHRAALALAVQAGKDAATAIPLVDLPAGYWDDDTAASGWQEWAKHAEPL